VQGESQVEYVDLRGPCGALTLGATPIRDWKSFSPTGSSFLSKPTTSEALRGNEVGGAKRICAEMLQPCRAVSLCILGNKLVPINGGDGTRLLSWTLRTAAFVFDSLDTKATSSAPVATPVNPPTCVCLCGAGRQPGGACGCICQGKRLGHRLRQIR
jgi:hypothetical protein